MIMVKKMSVPQTRPLGPWCGMYQFLNIGKKSGAACKWGSAAMNCFKRSNYQRTPKRFQTLTYIQVFDKLFQKGPPLVPCILQTKTLRNFQATEVMKCLNVLRTCASDTGDVISSRSPQSICSLRHDPLYHPSAHLLQLCKVLQTCRLGGLAHKVKGAVHHLHDNFVIYSLQVVQFDCTSYKINLWSRNSS